MATLVSPGVDVTVTDESAYASPGAGTIPLVVVATAQDKLDPTGTETDGIAKYTKSSTSGLVVPVTSQRELTQFFGDPTFASTEGAETSEYGLLAAYSYLGQGSQAYIVRAGIDLNELASTSTSPTGPANGNQIWIDTDASSYGLHQYVAASASWVLKQVTVEVDLAAAAGEVADPTTYAPTTAIASAGNYLVAILNDGGAPTGVAVGYFYSDGATWQYVAQANVAALPGSTVTFAPHFSSPSAPADGDIWVKTTQPGNGLNLVIHQSNSLGEFSLLDVAGIDNDAGAIAVTNISQANPAVVTVASTASLTDGDVIYINGGNMVEVNGYYTIDVLNATTFSLVGEDATGHTSFTPTTVYNITSISQANPAVVTVADTTGLTSGDTVAIAGVGGMIEITDGNYVITVIDGTTFSLDGIDSTGYTLYTSGGTATFTGTGTGTVTYYITQAGTSLEAIGLANDDIVIEVTATEGGFELKRVESGLPAALDELAYAQDAEPTGNPTAGQYWFDDTKTDLDILINDGTGWLRIAEANISYATSEPTAPSDDDIWIDTSASEREYPKIYRYDLASTTWLLYDNTDQSTEFGVLFDDFTAETRTALPSGDIVTNAFADVPDYQLYPTNMLAVNMAMSGNTVRIWDATTEDGLGGNTGAWVNGAANNADGSGAFGRLAQRRVISVSMQAAVAGNEDLRDPNRNFTLICAPNFPELTDELVTLNSDRGETAFIIIDTPMRKSPNEAISWVLGVGAAENGEDGLVTKNTYSAVYYPAGRSTTPAGDTVTVPPSHMVLYTYAYNDNISYPWFAPAGLTRGVVQNGSSVGFITTENEFKAVTLSQGQRDAAYTNKLNPIANFPLEGIVVFGQKSLHPTSSALDRVNVARLVAYLRERFDEIARPLLFEQNDKLTRDRAKQLFETFLSDLLSKRALTDFAVVCDESNNTPLRIDRNELYIDVAIAPTKAVEFIYIPIRIVNTGAL